MDAANNNTTERNMDKQLWWNDVMMAAHGEVELTYRPEYQDVPNGMFDLENDSITLQPVWGKGVIVVEMWMTGSGSHESVRILAKTSPAKAAKMIREAWTN
jgi:hypothetical protein